MGTAERRERERRQRRSDLIDAAEKIFFSKGFERATMEEVADAAELSKGTIYLYFKSKDDLYEAIIVRGLRILKLKFEAAVQGCVKGIEKVRSIGMAYVRFSDEYPHYFDAFIHYQGQETECFHTEDPLKILVESVREGIDDGSIRPDLDPLKAAIILWGQTTGVLQIMTKKCEAIRSAYGIEPGDIVSYYFDATYSMLRPR
jgi:AcrR family transcriptional regulator